MRKHLFFTQEGEDKVGILKEKYTKEYFTGRDKHGNELGYGALAERDINGEFVLRNNDAKILSRINFSCANVMEIGLGRGEAARYVLESGANSYTGIDFSQAAIDLSKETLKNCEGKYQLICMDALEYVSTLDKENLQCTDVVILFDVVEHIPRSELSIIIKKLADYCNEKVVFLINTPAYKYDNDVIIEGRNPLNDGGIDKSDEFPETVGMHCNKYTFESFNNFMNSCGLYGVSRMHYFIKTRNCVNMSYKYRWEEARKNGWIRLKEYERDSIEYAYNNTENDVMLYNFFEGNLANIKLWLLDNYREAAFHNGEYDIEMISDFMETTKNINQPIIFDVGGFMGVSSLLFAKNTSEKGKIYCFEPNPWNRGRIFDNLSENMEYGDKVEIIPDALGDVRGNVEMTLSTDIDNGYSSTSRLSAAHATIPTQHLPQGFIKHKVNVITLDDFVEEKGIIPDIIKVDIEGAEHLLLRGGIKTLSTHKPIMYIEIHSGFCAVECVNTLYGLGYSIEILHEDDDGRILIKCIDSKSSRIETHNSEMLYSFTNIINMQRNINNVLCSLSQSLKNNLELENEIRELNEKRANEIRELNEKIAQDSIVIAKKENEIKDIYESRGWLWLQRFRKFVRMFR